MQHLILILVGLICAAGMGYFIGYDHGFERTAPNTVQETATVHTAAETMANIIGAWQSTEDPKFVREILNDGTVVDSYAGEGNADGLWMVFTKEIPDTAFTGPLEDGVVYLSIAMSEDERYYFKVTKADAHTLELVYLDRGGVLSFNRAQ